MSKFLVKGHYHADGSKGLLKDGGSVRKAAVEKMLSSVGGKLDEFYFAFGDADVYAIIDVPDAVTAAALSMNVNASGVISLHTIPLLTAEELDKASKKEVKFIPANP